MDKIVYILKTIFFSFILLYVCIIVLYEFDFVNIFSFISPSSLIVIQYLMDIVTLVVIPLALYSFKIKFISKRLTSYKQLQVWSIIRILILCVPMVLNIFLYYYYCQEVSFFYLSVILLLSLFFVYPSKARCENELLNASDEKKE